MEVRLDDKVLQPFQLNEPRLETMRTGTTRCNLKLLQSDLLPVSEMRAYAMQLQKAYNELEKFHLQVEKELRRWQIRLEAERKRGFSGPDAVSDRPTTSGGRSSPRRSSSGRTNGKSRSRTIATS